MKSILLILIFCIPLALAQRTVTTYQEPLPIYHLNETISLSEPTWTYISSNTDSSIQSLCPCELYNNTILFYNNGLLTLLDIQNGSIVWQYENLIRQNFIRSNNSILILDETGFKTIDIHTGIVQNELIINANTQTTLANTNPSEDFILDYIYRDDVLYVNVGSIEEGGNLEAHNMRTGKTIWSRYVRETHRFQEIQNDVFISISSHPRPTTAFSAASHFTFTSTETGEALWSVVKSRRMIDAQIIDFQDNTVYLLRQSQNGSSRYFESVFQLNLYTGEHLGPIEGCKIPPPDNLQSPNGNALFNRTLDARNFVQDIEYMYIKTQNIHDTKQIYRQKRCDHSNFNPEIDKAIMYMSYANDKQWIAGPVNNTFFFTDQDGLYHVSTDSIEDYEQRIIRMPVLGHVIQGGSLLISLFFYNYSGVYSEVNHLRIYENNLLSGSKDGMFHVHDLQNNQLVLKADLDAEIILESFALENGFLVVTNNQISYFNFQE